jgi:hypothetical protein
MTFGVPSVEMRFRLTRQLLRGYGAVLGILGPVSDSIDESMGSDAQIGPPGRVGHAALYAYLGWARERYIKIELRRFTKT